MRRVFGSLRDTLTAQIGPLAAIYEIWRTSAPARSSTPVPIWILVRHRRSQRAHAAQVFGGALIVIGLATCVRWSPRSADALSSYGYHVMVFCRPYVIQLIHAGCPRQSHHPGASIDPCVSVADERSTLPRAACRWSLAVRHSVAHRC